MKQTKCELVTAIEFVRNYAAQSDEGRAQVLYEIVKSFPHVGIRDLIFINPDNLTTEQVANQAIQQEAERAADPVPPFITQADLVNNVAYLQQQFRDLGSKHIEVLIPLSLEYPNARLPEMIWQTHTDAPAEEIVAEIYRREAAANRDP